MTTYDGNPKGYTVMVNLGAGGGGWTDVTQYTTRAQSLTITRAGITSPQTVTVRLKKQGGGLAIPDYAGVRIFDPYMSALYTRYFNGFAQDLKPGVDGNANQIVDLVCVGVDWLLKNPPARFTTTITVGASPIWLPNHSYTATVDVVTAFPDVGRRYMCTQTGISGPTQPVSFDGTPGVIGIPDNTCLWAEDGLSAISDAAIWLSVLPTFYPGGEITYALAGLGGNITPLIASVPSFQITPDMTPDDVAKKLGSYAHNRSFYATFSARASSHAYVVGDEIEQSPSVHGIIWRCSHAGTTGSGGAPAALTTTTALGVNVTDGGVTWTSNRYTGRWEASITMQAGQRFEPQVINGFWYQVLVGGTTASSPPGTWNTTIGAIFTNGSVTIQTMGLTGVLPVWQLWTPSDNFAHDASWVPDFAWFDGNSQSQIIGPEYSEQVPADSEHINYGTLTINRLGAPHVNNWYVSGKNDSFAHVPNQPDIDAIGMAISGYYSDTSDTGPSTDNECYELGQRLNAASTTQETVQIGSLDILDPVMIQKLSIGAVSNTLNGLGSQQYQAAQVSVTLGLDGPKWQVNFGAGFATGASDPLQVVLGRPYAVDRTPPDLVTWPTDWVLANYVDPTTHLATVAIQWHEDSADTFAFNGYYLIAGDPNFHWFSAIQWPTTNHTFTGLPLGVDVTFYMSANDHFGNVLRNSDGTIRYSASPTLTTIAGPLPPSLQNPSFEHLRADGTAYDWTVTTVGAGVGSVDTTTASDGQNSFHFYCPSPSDEVLLTSRLFRAQYPDGSGLGAKNFLDLKMKRGTHNVNAIALYVDWYDQTLTLLGSQVLVTGLNLLTDFSSYHYPAIWPDTTPENTVAARLRFHCQPMSGAYDWWIDGLEFALLLNPRVQLDSGADIFTRGRLNFIEGPGIAITAAEDTTNGKVDLTISTVPSAPSGVVGGFRDQVMPSAAATTVTLTYTPTEMMTVARNGVEQSSALGHWSLTGNVLTFSDAFDGTDEVVAAYLIGGVVPVSPPTILVATVGLGKALSLWNGSSNDPPPAGWYTLAFVDTAWGLPGLGTATTIVVSGSDPIWSPAGSLAHNGEAVLHRRVFTLPSGSVTSAILQFAADDTTDEIWVNGTYIDPLPVVPSDTLVTRAVPNSALFAGGSNIIAFKFRDTGGGGHDLQYKLTVT